MTDIDVDSTLSHSYVVVALRGELTDPAGLLPMFASVEQAANEAQRPTASDCLVFARVNGEAPPGNGEAARARNDASAAASR